MDLRVLSFLIHKWALEPVASLRLGSHTHGGGPLGGQSGTKKTASALGQGRGMGSGVDVIAGGAKAGLKGAGLGSQVRTLGLPLLV